VPPFYASAALCATLTILAPCFGSDRLLAASPAGAADTPEHSAPQGNDPPGPDTGEQETPPPAENKGVIPPPPTGDEGIHVQVPNPNAGSDQEVIPPPDTPDGAK
jgi:hypothetical protein